MEQPILDNLRRRSFYETAMRPTTTVDLPDKLPPVNVPFEVAKFVVRALVENAWRHRGDRPLRLALVGTVSDGSLDLEVKDRGPGMTPADAANLFQAGFRSDTARREFLLGSGMGLYLARSALRLYGGEIKLSQEANPTVFTIRFPLSSKGRGKLNKQHETEIS